MAEDFQKTRRDAAKKAYYARVTADERPGPYFAPWEKGDEEEQKRIGAHPSQGEKLPAMSITVSGFSKPEEKKKKVEVKKEEEAEEETEEERRASQEVEEQIARQLTPAFARFQQMQRGMYESFTKMLDPKTRRDFEHYQNELIYNDVGYDDVLEAASADLNLRLNQPEKYGTVTSSEHPDWNGTGWTMHTVEGEDATRHFLENPSTSEVFNLTGHPDVEKE